MRTEPGCRPGGYGGCDNGDSETVLNDNPGFVGIFCNCDGLATGTCSATVTYSKATGVY